MRIAIVIIAYNRPHALKRLLNSINKAQYHTHVDIIISIDNGEKEQEVTGIANNFEWHRGTKEVIAHNHKLGLKQHLLLSGNLAKGYDAFVLLEDDLVVSPQFFSFVHQALPYYLNSNEVAGISLYHQHYHHALMFPFSPLADNSDIYFMQYPSSWGAVYVKEQWDDFMNWLTDKDDSALDSLPDNIKNWPASSWKKWMAAYLVANNKYYVYPRVSLTTNMGDKGEHHPQQVNELQSPLQFEKRDYTFCDIKTSKAIYDVYMEPHPSVFGLEEDIEVDLYGLKPSYSRPYILTTKKVKNPIKQWGLNLKPIELNILMDNDGEEISLAKKDDVIGAGLEITDWWNYHYIAPSGTDLVKLLGEKVKKKLK